MGKKPPDSRILPLCAASPGREGCHAEQGRIGEARYWSERGVDPEGLCRRLWTVSGNDDLGERALMMFRQRIRLAEATKAYTK